MKTVVIRVSGRVQGVGFRYYVYKVAHQLSVKGIVKNCTNGDVYIEAEADSDALHQFIGMCRIGSSRSVVDDVLVGEIESVGYSTFEIVG